MHIVRRLLLLALLGAVVWAGVQFVRTNESPVTVDLLLTQISGVALWLTLLVAFGLGAVLAAALCLFEVARYGMVARRYRKTAARLESEIHQLRNLPLADEGGVPEIAGEPSVVAPPGGPAASRG